MKSGGSSNSTLIYWALALALAAGGIWIWWSPHRMAKHPKARVAASPPAFAAHAPTPRLQKADLIISTNVPAPSQLPLAQETNSALTNSDQNWPRPVANLFEAQVALVGDGISPGSIDGVAGSQTRAALMAFQNKEHLPVTGQLDVPTRERLQLLDAPLATYTVTAEDLTHLQPLSPTWLGKSQQSALDYETVLEMVAEKSFTHPNLIRRLNPGVNWANVPAGTVLKVPNPAYPEPDAKAAFVVIHLAAKTLEAFDANTNLLAHFPCSIARRVEKRPVGELHVAVVAPHPNYTFDPDLFPESPEAHQINHKLILPPGPNNPVGVAWIGLDKPGYGIHGTPKPEEVGRTESHGCFRLANWNAEYLMQLVTIGTPVFVLE